MTELKCVNGRSNSDDHHEVEESQVCSSVYRVSLKYENWYVTYFIEK